MRFVGSTLSEVVAGLAITTVAQVIKAFVIIARSFTTVKASTAITAIASTFTSFIRIE